MKAAVTVELDGATFVLDEGAFHALRSYLDRAAARLARHPDRVEVLAGLEGSIAEKLGEGPAGQGVPVDRDDMVAALALVGRVDGPELAEGGAEASSESAAGSAASSNADASAKAGASAGFGSEFGAGFGAGRGGAAAGARARPGAGPEPDPRPAPRARPGPRSGAAAGRAADWRAYARARSPRRLYRLRNGQQVAGVCKGLSAFSEIDVGMIRFLFLLGIVFSGGALLLGYVVLMFAMPLARTEAEIAEARGGLPAG
jgi:phage shock protein PspC (stress-responsive transcriptional regulator)